MSQLRQFFAVHEFFRPWRLGNSFGVKKNVSFEKAHLILDFAVHRESALFPGHNGFDFAAHATSHFGNTPTKTLPQLLGVLRGPNHGNPSLRDEADICQILEKTNLKRLHIARFKAGAGLDEIKRDGLAGAEEG